MILFAGDCHGDFIPLIEEADEASTVVLLGDQEPLTDLAVELGPGVAPKTWWIYGNHDSDYQCYFDNHAPMAARNLHCRVVEIEGVRIAGLGGVFRAKKFKIDQTTRLNEVDLNCPQDARETWIKLRRGGRSYPADFTSIFPDDLTSGVAPGEAAETFSTASVCCLEDEREIRDAVSEIWAGAKIRDSVPEIIHGSAKEG
ncbi:MAG: hypothetical protein Q7J24_05985 [Desulfomicrobium sp.]|nr:hypothetical protein [Desulfomicrobium sp.]